MINEWAPGEETGGGVETQQQWGTRAQAMSGSAGPGLLPPAVPVSAQAVCGLSVAWGAELLCWKRLQIPDRPRLTVPVCLSGPPALPELHKRTGNKLFSSLKRGGWLSTVGKLAMSSADTGQDTHQTVVISGKGTGTGGWGYSEQFYYLDPLQ